MKCLKCNEIIEEGFSSCWKCGRSIYSQKNVEESEDIKTEIPKQNEQEGSQYLNKSYGLVSFYIGTFTSDFSSDMSF